MRGAAHCRGCGQYAGSFRKPGGPVHPPAAIVLGRILPPCLGRLEAGGGLNRPICAFATRRIDDPGNVTAGSNHETHVTAHELRDTPSRPPGHNVVLLGSDGIDVVPDTAQIEFFSVQLDPAGHDQIILHVSVTQVPAMCGACHTRAVAVPVEEVKGRRILTEQVVVHDVRPDQVVRTQNVEHVRHLATVEIAALHHLLLDKIDPRVVHEYRGVTDT